MGNKIAIVFFITICLMAGFCAYVLAHEITHLALADESYGICLGRCYNSSIQQPEVSIANSHGKHNALSQSEFWPSVAGVCATLSVLICGLYSFMIINKKKVVE